MPSASAVWCGLRNCASPLCPPERLLRGDTALACARTKQFCCFIGSEETVEKQLRDLEILA